MSILLTCFLAIYHGIIKQTKNLKFGVFEMRILFLFISMVSCISNIEKISESGNDNFSIYNGADASKTENPFFVSLADERGIFCGGMQIAPNYVITAAQCVNVKDFGPFNLYMESYCNLGKEGSYCEDDSHLVLYENFGILKHPQFEITVDESENEKVFHDLALIRLKDKYQPKNATHFNMNNAFILKPTEAEDMSSLINKRKLFLYGMGKLGNKGTPEVLQKMNKGMTLINNRYCNHSADDPVLCMKGEGTSACEGDSGSVLLKPSGSLPIYGIVSVGHDCWKEPFITTYVHLPSYYDWMIPIIEKNVEPKPHGVSKPIKPELDKPDTEEREYTYNDYAKCKRLAIKNHSDQNKRKKQIKKCRRKFNKAYPNRKDKLKACLKDSRGRDQEIRCVRKFGNNSNK